MRSGECNSVVMAESNQAGPESAETDEATRVQELYREHSLSLVRQLTRKTGCREVARDIANETFLRVLRMKPGNIGRIEHPEAFLRRISTNLLRDWRRASALRERSQSTIELASGREIDQVTALESRDLLRRLEHAVSRLKPKTRAIFLAHRVHGFTYSEIAEQTGLSVKAVEKQMSNAIANIDRLLNRAVWLQRAPICRPLSRS
jgi:RNA polymerase sigma-70 factor (ECF subfamily)